MREEWCMSSTTNLSHVEVAATDASTNVQYMLTRL